MAQRDPNIVRSGLSHRSTQGEVTVDVEIYRLENETGWALEVVDQKGGSTVWEDLFPTDDVALEEFETTLRREGLLALIQSSNVISFRR